MIRVGEVDRVQGEREVELRSLHRLFRKAQQNNRSVAEFTLAEQLALIEIQTASERGVEEDLLTPKDVAASLSLEQSIVSRLLARLEQRRAIESRVSSIDARRRLLRPTREGSDYLRQVDQRANEILSSRLEGLSLKEQKAVHQLYRKLADGLGVERSIQRKSDHPLRPDQRRLTRAFGLIGKSYGGFPLAPSEWHILAELLEQEMNSTELSTRIGLPLTTVGQIVSRLELRGLLTRKRSKFDRRKQSLSLTKNGRALVEEVECSFVNRFDGALLDSSNIQLKKFREAFEKFTGVETVTLIEGRTLKVSTEAGERAQARTFLLEELVRSGNHPFAGERLLPKDSICVLSLSAGVLDGVFQFELENTTLRLSLAAWGREMNEKALLEVLNKLGDLLESSIGRAEWELAFPPLERVYYSGAESLNSDCPLNTGASDL